MSSLSFYLVVIVTALLALVTAQCYEDNCLRAMFPCRTESAQQYTSATQYCATRTFEDSTRTNYPTHATSACRSDQTKIFSACVCGPTCYPLKGECVPPPAPTGAILYDSLDCKLPVVEKIDAPARYAILDDGYSKGAFKGWLGGVKGWQSVFSLRVHYRDLAVIKGKPVRISYKVQFIHADAGMVRTRIESENANNYFPSPLDREVWSDVVVDVLPTSNNLTFSIDYAFSSQNAWIKVDNILVKYV